MTRLFFWVFIAIAFVTAVLYGLGVKDSNWVLPAEALGMAVVAHFAIRLGL